MLSELSLFVYGSFSEGMVHFSKIRQYVTSKQAAYAPGTAYRLPSGYPAYLLPNGPDMGDQVPGEHLILHAPELIFKLLDEFHGVSIMAPEKSLHFKENIQVQVANGEFVNAWVYSINPAKLPRGAQRIPRGDWLSDWRSQPALPDRLTDRQANYIRRLAKSSGREIVPIDLALYRELIKLELVIDKGRRLALTALGKEVARYLPEAELS